MNFLLKLFIISIFILFYCNGYSIPTDKVAIFDFDNRGSEVDTDAKFIEKKIKEINPNLLTEHYNANSDEQLAIKILKEIDVKNYKLIIIITSDALRISQHILKKTPFLFTNVNNPIFLGVSDLKNPGYNRSGVSYYIPVEKHIEFIKELKPSAKKIGFIFDDEAVSRDLEFREARNYCNKIKINFAFALIKTTQDLEGAANKLISENSDIIVITSSNKIYDNTEIVTSIAYSNKTPVYSYNKKGVINGAIASLSIDYKDLIELYLTPMLKKVLIDNINPGTIPVTFPESFNIFLNVTKAKEINLNLSESLIKKSSIKY